jgi:acyl-CoA thioester hydrolase
MSVFFDIFQDGTNMPFPRRTTIPSHTITIRPRYAETDQSGVVHHTVYPVWFEMGRTELLRVNGVVYKDLEAAGIFFVVVELFVKYRQSAKYDEKLQLETICTRVTPSRIEHTYKLGRCSDGTVLTEGTSVLACVDAQGKIQRIPDFLYPEEQNDNTCTTNQTKI